MMRIKFVGNLVRMPVPRGRRQYPDGREAQRGHVRHERTARENVQWGETIEKRRPNCCCATEDFPDEQKEKWQRDGQENYGLAAPNPFLDASKFVTNSRKKRQYGKFRSHVAGRIASPINLRISKTKTVLEEISRNRRHVALPPAPVINVGLID